MADCNPMLTVVPLDKTSVSSVTVYSDRAEVTRLVSVAGLSPGVHEITVEGLTSKADEDSIRIKAGPGCRRSTLLEVSFEVHNKPVADAADGSAAEAKLAELKDLQTALAVATDELARESASKKLIDTYVRGMLAPGNDHPPPVGEKLAGVRELLSFHATAAADHSSARFRIEAERAALGARIEAAEAALRRMWPSHRPRTKTSRDVQILVRVDEPAPAGKAGGGGDGGGKPEPSSAPLALLLTYMVSGASWEPSYDLRVETSGKEGPHMGLTYLGLVCNASGEDWIQCGLSLSTAKPSRGGMPPAPPRRMLGWQPEVRPPTSGWASFEQPRCHARMSRCGAFPTQAMCRSPSPMDFSTASMERQQSMDADDDTGALFDMPAAAVAENTAGGAATLSVERKVSIAADNKPHRVTVAMLGFSPSLVYFSTPSLEQAFYLQVRATNTSPFPLLASAKVACFLDGSFVTTSQLKDIQPSEDFTTFLGVDPSVKMEHASLAKAHRSAQGWSSKQQSATHRFRTKITNTKATPVRLTVVEVLPKPTEDKIKVELIAPAKADVVEVLMGGETGAAAAAAAGGEEDRILHNGVTNNVVWHLALKPGEKRELTFEYSVTWPADKNIHEYSAS